MMFSFSIISPSRMMITVLMTFVNSFWLHFTDPASESMLLHAVLMGYWKFMSIYSTVLIWALLSRWSTSVDTNRDPLQLQLIQGQSIHELGWNACFKQQAGHTANKCSSKTPYSATKRRLGKRYDGRTRRRCGVATAIMFLMALKLLGMGLLPPYTVLSSSSFLQTWPGGRNFGRGTSLSSQFWMRWWQQWSWRRWLEWSLWFWASSSSGYGASFAACHLRHGLDPWCPWLWALKWYQVSI